MSKNAAKIRIEIVNPLPGMQRTTTLAHARRYRRAGRADIVEGKLVFREEDPRHASVRKCAAALLRYDDGLATLDGLKNTPIVKPVRLLTGKRLAAPVREDRVVSLTSVRVDRVIERHAIPAFPAPRPQCEWPRSIA